MWNLLIAPLADLAKQHFANKAEEKQAKHQATLKRIEGEQSWDETQAANSNNSFKDEWFVLVLSVPMIGAFIPSVVPYIEEGFRVLDGMPDYYKGFLGAAIAASFGIKALSNWGGK